MTFETIITYVTAVLVFIAHIDVIRKARKAEQYGSIAIVYAIVLHALGMIVNGGAL